MKKYILLYICICISIQAKDNPFELKENLQKIDKDQEVLLSALKEISDVQKIGEDVVQVQSKNAVEQKKYELKFQKIKEKQEKIEEQKKLNFALKKELQVKQEKALPKEKQEEFQGHEKEHLEVEAYEKKRAEKKTKEAYKNDNLPQELQLYKDIINCKVQYKGKSVEGKVKTTFEQILQEKNNSNFSLVDARKIIDGNKDTGLVIVAYMMSKSVVYYNQLTSVEKEKYNKAEIVKVKNKADNFDLYAKKYPNELKEMGFALIEDILVNGIPQMDFNMKLSGKYSSEAGKSKPLEMEISMQPKANKVISDINITQEQMLSKKEADKVYLEAIAEMDRED